jgi:hypothetical protein
VHCRGKRAPPPYGIGVYGVVAVQIECPPVKAIPIQRAVVVLDVEDEPVCSVTVHVWGSRV